MNALCAHRRHWIGHFPLLYLCTCIEFRVATLTITCNTRCRWLHTTCGIKIVSDRSAFVLSVNSIGSTNYKATIAICDTHNVVTLMVLLGSLQRFRIKSFSVSQHISVMTFRRHSACTRICNHMSTIIGGQHASFMSWSWLADFVIIHNNANYSYSAEAVVPVCFS